MNQSEREIPEMTEREKQVHKRSEQVYRRGAANKTKGVEDKKLKSRIKGMEEKYKAAALAATRAELLHPSEAGYLEAEGMERTYKFTQKAISDNVDLATTKKMLDLKLDSFGPYFIDYTASGRHMVLAGSKGHLAIIDSLRQSIITEFNVRETVRDVHFLHSQSMFAVAQNKHVYIYDDTGMEIHCLRDQQNINKLDYLRYHFLLVSIGRGGVLQYRDTSTGAMISQHRTKLGPCDCLAQNPRNAIINLGHANGTLTMWSPNMSSPVVKMLCHKGPVCSLDVDLSGNYLVTGGGDSQLKVWDIRTYKQLHSYFTTSPPASVSISQRGFVAVGLNSHVQVWKDALSSKAKAPYMTHRLPGKSVACVKFQNYEDVLGIGHQSGVTTMVAPGVGEPNFDSFEANPFQTKKQRREAEIHSLLEKLKPDMISLDSSCVGKVARNPQDRQSAEIPQQQLHQPKNKARGKNKIGRKLKRKQKNVISEEREALRKQLKQASSATARAPSPARAVPSSLKRFKNNAE